MTFTSQSKSKTDLLSYVMFSLCCCKPTSSPGGGGVRGFDPPVKNNVKGFNPKYSKVQVNLQEMHYIFTKNKFFPRGGGHV